MLFNRKVEISFSKEYTYILDGQYKICNWLYNHLLDMVIDDYKNNDNVKKLLSSRNLRNQVPKIKKEHTF